MREEVSVGGASLVVAGEDGVEGNHPVVVGLLDTAQVGGIPAVSGVVAGCRDATVRSAGSVLGISDEVIPVDTGGIGVPDIHHRALYRPAGVDVDVLHLKGEVDTVTVLLLSDVLAQNLSPDVVGAVGNGRG